MSPADVHLERPARREHGDWSTNAALVNAKKVGRPPRELAAELVEALQKDPPPHLVGVELAGPGFVNLRARARLAPGHPQGSGHGGGGRLRPSRSGPRRESPGRVHLRQSHRTPPCGQRLVGLVRRCPGEGHDPLRVARSSREYYVNDTGSQIRTLGSSLLARRRGEEVEEGGYQGGTWLTSPRSTRARTIPLIPQRSKLRGSSLPRGSSIRSVRHSSLWGSSSTAGTARPR